MSGQGTWESTLQGRDLDGNTTTFEAYYDTVLDITWLADANYAQTSSFDADGWMPWADAGDWVRSLNIGGITGWRLPTVVDTGSPGCDFAYSGTDCGFNVDTATGELAHMFYVTLGNKAYYDDTGNPAQPGSGLSNTGPFSNVKSFSYWTDTVFATNAGFSWHFDFILGHQGGVNQTSDQYVWPVYPGDVLVRPPRCDLNNNGKVDAGDLLLVVKMVMNTTADDLDCDIDNAGDGNGVISVADLLILTGTILE